MEQSTEGTVSEEPQWDSDTYLKVVAALDAKELMHSVCKRLGITRDTYKEIGVLAYGGDGWSRHIYEMMRK